MEDRNNFFNDSFEQEPNKDGSEKEKKFNLGLAVGFLIAGLIIFFGFMILMAFSENKVDKKTNNLSVESVAGLPPGIPQVEPIDNPAIRTFLKKKDSQICTENGKPMIYLFSTSWCPHCQWIEDTFLEFGREVNASGKARVYLFDVEKGDDLLTEAKETAMSTIAESIYEEFSPDGGIPTFVFGCKYFRVGNGYEMQPNGEELEKREFMAILDDLLK